MRVQFLQQFDKDLDRIKDKMVLRAVRQVIEVLEVASSLREIPRLKKLSGFRNAYRIRVGEYRIGIIAEQGVIEVARIPHRKEMYKRFP